MHIRLELFGPQAQLVGQRMIELVFLEPNLTCEGLRARLVAEYPMLANSLPQSRFAVNHRFAQEDQMIRGDDQIALIGMVSGG